MLVSLVRHTAVDIKGQDLCYGYSDVPVLQEVFASQAENLRQSIVHFTPDAIFSSPLSRARKLADYCGFAPIIEDRRLMEMNFGEWEMKNWNEIIHTEDIPAFFQYYIEHKVPGGESLTDQRERVKEFLEEKKKEGWQHILVFCHGGVINCAKSIIEDKPLEEAFSSLPPYASLTQLTYE